MFCRDLHWGGNQLPVSATRWQHWYYICFATFIWWNTTKLAKNSTTTNASEKISTDLESIELKKVDACITKFKNNKILLNKIIHRSLLTTKLFTGWNSLIAISFPKVEVDLKMIVVVAPNFYFNHHQLLFILLSPPFFHCCSCCRLFWTILQKPFLIVAK
jgi:hypothetical protein